MTVPLQPGERFLMSLRRHEQVPSGQRPAFEFKFLSARQQREVAAQFDAHQGNGPDEIDAVFKLLGEICTGWRNVIDPGTDLERPFSAEALMDVLCLGDSLSLIYRFLGHSPGADDFLGCSGPASSPPAKSASPAAAPDATAKPTG